MCGCIVKVKVGLFDGFAMVTLRVREPKQSLFQEVIFLVPEAECHIQQPMGIRDPSYAVFAPSESSCTCVVI